MCHYNKAIYYTEKEHPESSPQTECSPGLVRWNTKDLPWPLTNKESSAVYIILVFYLGQNTGRL